MVIIADGDEFSSPGRAEDMRTLQGLLG